jgi:uncharacterized protein (DUF1015 family)
MAVVAPVPAVRYDETKVALRDAIAPPYDVISSAEQEALYARSPYNVIRLILPREAERGPAASATLKEWMSAGVLARDAAPGLYLYGQTFTLPNGTTRRREGVICRLRCEDFATGIVRPHERTLEGPKADRLAILRATGAHLSPIFGLYAHAGESAREMLGVASGSTPLAHVTEGGGNTHDLWRVTDAAAIARFTAALAPETIFIADGHHRYETALAYARERGGDGPSAYVLAYLANVEEGMVILPTHRLVATTLILGAQALDAELRKRFTIAPLRPDATRIPGAIDLVLPERRLRLRALPAALATLERLPPAVRSLDVALLHEAILQPMLGLGAEDLQFTHDDAEAEDAVHSGRASAAFLVHPPSIAQVRAVCMAGELMPQKSTYFYPKLASGLVFDLVGPPWV